MREKLEQIKRLAEDLLRDIEAKEAVPPKVVAAELKDKEFELLKSLVNSDSWPPAVLHVQIADDNSENDKQERAEGICEILLPPISGKSFLDFGCGEGYAAKYVSKDAKVSVGYDIKRSPNSKLKWEEKEGDFLLTTDFEKAKAAGPYDVILMYDVLDHCEGDTPASVLSKAASLLADGGRMYVRFHPWCGRHGGHVYKKLNKAFAHLVFSQDELRNLGAEAESAQRVFAPLNTYANIIETAGLKQESEPEIDSQEVESFFSENPLVRERILKHWGLTEWGSSPPAFQMSQCFVDYVLKK